MAPKTRLWASSPTLEGILKHICRFYGIDGYSGDASYTLTKLTPENRVITPILPEIAEYCISTPKTHHTITDAFVRRKGGRFRFESIVK